MYEARCEHTLQRYRITVEDCQYTVFIQPCFGAATNRGRLLFEGGFY